MESTADCAIGIMAKAPRPGLSKTRLCPPLSHDQAAALSAAFLRDVSENIALAARQASIAGYVAYAPEGQEALFDEHLAPGTKLVLADGSPLMPPNVLGFGRCLLHAILGMLAHDHPAAVVLNADSPTLPTALLVRTAAALAAEGDRVVLGPAEDGGYYLLGMKAAHAHLFADIAWSTDTVAATTRLRAAELGLEVVELPIWYDVDDRAALERLLNETAVRDEPPTPAPTDGGNSSTARPGSIAQTGAMTRRGSMAIPALMARPGSEAPAVLASTQADNQPYAAPFTARALERMGLRPRDSGLATE